MTVDLYAEVFGSCSDESLNVLGDLQGDSHGLSADDLVAEFERQNAPETEDSSRSVCSCGAGILRVDYDLVCSDCGSVQEGRYDPDEGLTKEPIQQSHFRITGSGAYIYQSNLYKSSESNYSETQKIHNERTYRARLNEYMKKGLKPPFPINVCRKGMELYHQVQQHCIKRSENRNIIIAACMYLAGADMGSVPPIQEVTKFMGLTKQGISSGMNFLMQLRHEGKITFDPHQGITRAKIKTLFSELKINAKRATPLGLAVMDVIDTMKVNNIGASLHIDTKVIGATFCVLQRAKELESRPGVSEFCTKCKTRKNTVLSIVDKLNDHHSYFEQVYVDHDLYADRLG